MKKSKVFILLLVLIFTLATQCKPKPDDNSPENYNKKTMLTNIANNYIIPAYLNYKNQTITLNTLISEFVATPNTTNLANCRSQLKETILAWQEVAMLEFGPAESISLRSQTNIYPADTTLINSNISSNSYDLQLPSNYDAKGLQTLDYLLHKPSMTDMQLAAHYVNSANAKTYLTTVTNEITTNANSVYTDWQSTYSTAFINNNETTAQGSSISNLINALSLHYETFVRKGKIGVPSGVFNGVSQQVLPGHVEGYYSGSSIDFAISEMQAISKLIKGENYTNAENGQGLDDYLNFVEAKNGEDNLSLVIENKINTIINNLNALSGSLSSNISSNPAGVNLIYQSMQQLVPLIKVELTSNLGVLVSYQDNDGD
jgi:predicted lipoprotein